MKNNDLFPFIHPAGHGIIGYGNDPHACIMVVISHANLVNQIWVQDLCIDEAIRHSKGVF